MAGWGGDRHGEEDWEPEDEPNGTEGSAEEVLPEAEGDEAEPARLDLDDDERLPWLESVDDEDDYEESDTGRLVAMLIGGLVVLAALVGGIWWATHRNAEPELQADGSVILAPETPYKEAPEDPGGKTFAGTGDTSYAVSEGETRAPQLAEKDGSARPSIDLSPKPVASESPAPAASSAPSGVGVQVGAFTSRASAETGWTRLSQQNESLFSGLKHRVVEGRADIGTVYRLQALAADRAAANDLCGRFKAAGVACQVKD